MKIEPFNASDSTAGLEALTAKAFGGSDDGQIDEWFSFAEMQAEIARGRGIGLIATDGRLAGFIYAQQESPINGREGVEKWVIVMAAVDPERSGQGVGTALLGGIEQAARGHGATKMFVYTNQEDERVRHFYRKNGYADAGSIRDYQYGKDNSAAFLLKYL